MKSGATEISIAPLLVFMSWYYLRLLEKRSRSPMFMTMYEMNINRGIIDQLRPRRIVKTHATNITPTNPTRCLWIGVPGFMFFLNFIENIGISLTRRRARSTDPIGMNSIDSAHP